MIDISQEFADFMDATKMKALFQQALPECLSGKWDLTGCEIQHPRFKTYLNPESRDKSFLALAYHLEGVNKKTNAADNRILYVKAYLGERSRNVYLEYCSKTQGMHQDAMLHLHKYGMVGWFFPYDPALPWLSTILNNKTIGNYLANFLLVQKNIASPVIKDVSVNIINYRPEIRCTYRLNVQRLSGNYITLYGKTYADDEGAEIQRRITYFYQRALDHQDSFVVPTPLGYDATLRTIWTHGIEGKPLAECLTEQNADRLMAFLARHLANFHGASISGLEPISEDDLLAEIQKKSAKLQKAFPELSERIDGVLLKLIQQKPHLPLPTNCLVHGDFHIGQLMLLDNGRLALFDFDELAMANPLMDVANFCAALKVLNFEEYFTERLIKQLFKGYQSSSASVISTAHFEWHLQVQLLTRAYRAYIQQKPDLEWLINQFITAAECGYTEKNTG